MNSGLIPDGMITASSFTPGREPIHSRAPVDPGECVVPADNQEKRLDERLWPWFVGFVWLNGIF